MNKISQHIIMLVSLAFAQCQMVMAQTFSKDAARCHAFYQTAKSVAFTASVTTFSSATDKKGTLTGTGTMAQMEGFYYSSFQKDEVLMTPARMIILDHNEKTMLCHEREPLKNEKTIEKDFDKIFESDSIVYGGIVNGNKIYTLYSPKKSIVKTEVYFNEEKGYLSKLVYYYAASNEEITYDAYKTEVMYTNVKTNHLDKNDFKTSKYIQGHGQSLAPADTYKNYKFITPKN